MDVEDEADDDNDDAPTDPSQPDHRNTTSCDISATTDDSSYVQVDDENKENSVSDTTPVELLL